MTSISNQWGLFWLLKVDARSCTSTQAGIKGQADKIPVVTEIHLYVIDQREICARIFLSFFFFFLFFTVKFVGLLNVNMQQSVISNSERTYQSLISDGNRTVGSILVCNHASDVRIGWPRSGSPMCLPGVWLQTELDDTKSYWIGGKLEFFKPIKIKEIEI